MEKLSSSVFPSLASTWSFSAGPGRTGGRKVRPGDKPRGSGTSPDCQLRFNILGLILQHKKAIHDLTGDRKKSKLLKLRRLRVKRFGKREIGQ